MLDFLSRLNPFASAAAPVKRDPVVETPTPPADLPGAGAGDSSIDGGKPNPDLQFWKEWWTDTKGYVVESRPYQVAAKVGRWIWTHCTSLYELAKSKLTKPKTN